MSFLVFQSLGHSVIRMLLLIEFESFLLWITLGAWRIFWSQILITHETALCILNRSVWPKRSIQIDLLDSAFLIRNIIFHQCSIRLLHNPFAVGQIWFNDRSSEVRLILRQIAGVEIGQLIFGGWYVSAMRSRTTRTQTCRRIHLIRRSRLWWLIDWDSCTFDYFCLVTIFFESSRRNSHRYCLNGLLIHFLYLAITKCVLGDWQRFLFGIRTHMWLIKSCLLKLLITRITRSLVIIKNHIIDNNSTGSYSFFSLNHDWM